MTGQEIINRILETLEMKAPTFADNIGILYQRVFDLQKGKTKRISPQVADAIINVYPQFSLSWILTGEGEMIENRENPIVNESLVEQPGKVGYLTYLLPMSAMGGSLTGFAESGVTLQNCEAVISPIENVDFAITVYGESMAPEYPSGSRILIKKINPDIFIDWGKVFVLDTPNGVIVKEIHESIKEGYIGCHSINTNPKFKPFNVPMDEIYGIYRVLMCLSAK